MRKVLVAHEKHSDRVFDISTEKLRDRAFLTLFRERDKEGYYLDLIEMKSSFYSEAKDGNAKSARTIILSRSRNNYEYERMEEIDVE